MRWFAVFLCLITSPVWAGSWKGVPRIVDGDTVTIDGIRLRFVAMDAFETDQNCHRESGVYACGVEATYALADLIRGRVITCTGDKRDRNGRPLVVCELDGVDLGRALVRAGWAVPEYGHQYDAERDQARADRAGAWVGTFVSPREWRKWNHAPVETTWPPR